MEKFGLYDKLISIPLFIGMSKQELEQIVSKTKFNFRKYKPGEIILQQGEKCGQLALLIDGSLEATASSDNNSYQVSEFLSAPLTLQIDGIFGRTQVFTRTYKATTPCNFIFLDKNEILNLTSNSFIFRLNLFSIISTALQKKEHEAWQTMPKNLTQGIIRFMTTHCTYPAGKKIIKIKMESLAHELHTNRQFISKELNTLQKKGLLTLTRGKITIDTFEKLISATR